MADRNDDKHLKDNAGRHLEPKDAKHEDRLARGDIGMPGPEDKKFSPQAHNIYLKDHQREQDKAHQQRSNQAPERNFSKENTEATEKTINPSLLHSFA